MARDNPHLSVRVRAGSALERLLESVEGSTATDRLHTLAERFEAVGDVREAVIQALRDRDAELDRMPF